MKQVSPGKNMLSTDLLFVVSYLFLIQEDSHIVLPFVVDFVLLRSDNEVKRRNVDE